MTNPWDRIFGNSGSRGSYNKDCEDHANAMAELSKLLAERDWLKQRSETIENRIKQIQRGQYE